MEWRIYISGQRRQVWQEVKENAFWLSDKDLEADIKEKYENGRLN
tara:strand:- start:537 stop:671 length:135 start_codon:yes stop_codon:yes gene_type:complete